MRRSLAFQQQYYADNGMWMETQAQQHGYAFHEESWSSDNNNYHKRFPAMHMNRLAAFAVDSDLSMSKQHAKLGAMHMNRLADFALDSELSMSKQHGKLGSMHMNMLSDFAMDSELSMSKQHGKLGGMHTNRVGAFGTDSQHSISKQHGKYGNMFQEGMHSDHGFGHGGGRKFPFGGHANNNASHHFSNGGGKYNSGGHHEYYSEAYAEEHVGAITAKVEEMRYQQHNWGGDTCYVNPYDRNKNWRTPKGV